MAIDKGKFTVLNGEGMKVECDVLFTFESEETHKNYIVYTDNSVDVDGSTKVYASTFDPEGNDTALKPIENDKEWKVIETILAEIQESVKGGGDNELDAYGDCDLGFGKSEGVDSGTEDGIFADFPFFETADNSMDYEDLVNCIENKKNLGNDKLGEGLLESIVCRLETETAEEHIDYLFKVLDDNDISHCSVYSHMGIESYSNGNFIVAEEAFRRAVIFCKEDVLRIGYASKLAYLIRRKEIRNPEMASSKEFVELLKPGIAKKDTSSLINMALFWALNMGRENDWKMADELISLVSKSDEYAAYLWRLDVGNKDDVESQLVHLLLIRNGKIAKSPLGEMKVLFDKVKAQYTTIPAEFKKIVTPFDDGTKDTLPCLDD